MMGGREPDEVETLPTARFPKWGDPAGKGGFDPDQVYVLGEFRGTAPSTNVYGRPCGGPVTGIPDWSWPDNDRDTTNGMVVAVPCETFDHRVRLDGSLVYEIAYRAVRLFVQEQPAVGSDGALNIVTGAPEAGPTADPEIALCGEQPGFRHFLDPVDGTVVIACDRGQSDRPVVFERWGQDGHWGRDARVSVDVPVGYEALHLGGDGTLLLQGLAVRDDLAVWTPDGMVVFSVANSFDATRISAVRATADGFMLLVIDGESPPSLALWRISNEGEIEWGTDYPSAANGVHLESRCRPVGPPSRSTESAPPISYAHESSCVCALQPSGAALCIGLETDDSQVVLHFDPEADSAEVVLRTDDRLLTIFRLFTGP